jgi:hypothetical protein
MRQVARQVVEAGYITGTYGAGFGVRTKVKGVGPSLVGSQHGSGRGGLRVGWGDAEGEPPCANIEILTPCELQVLERHDVGRGDLVGDQLEGGAGLVQGLLDHIALRHTLRPGSPLMKDPDNASSSDTRHRIRNRSVSWSPNFSRTPLG